MAGRDLAEPIRRRTSVCDDTWFTEAELALHAAGGAAGVEQLRAESGALPPSPVVSVFGVYDAGKSSLLKRLLVDAGVAIPPWLTVSARRETFEVNEVEAFGCVLRDTPGIATGNTAHEELALEAVAGSDVVMLVMPPQLLTGDRDLTLSILSGAAFRPGGLQMAASLLVVIAKLDEGAVDPVEDPFAYGEYVQRKRAEWQTLLESHGVGVTEAPVFAVAADPFQRVGNDGAPAREDYDSEYRSWDGVAELVSALSKLPTHLTTLRRSAQARQLCWQLWARVEAIERTLNEIGATQNEAARNRQRFEIFSRKYQALCSLARNELDRTIAEELLTFARQGLMDTEAVANRLEDCITQWDKSQTAALDRLVSESQAELETRDRAQRARVTTATEEPTHRLRLSLDRTLLQGAAQHARTAFDEYTTFKLAGKTLAEARKASSLPIAQRDKSLPTTKTIDTMFKLGVVINLLPQLVDLGAMIYGAHQKAQDAKAQEAARMKARQQLQNLGKEIADKAWGDFAEYAQGFSDWIDANLIQAGAGVEAAQSEAARLKGVARMVRDVLEREPPLNA